MRLIALCEDQTKIDHVGFFVKLPEDLAKQYPNLDPDEDTSSPHITVLYIGKANEKDLKKIEKVGKRVISKHGPIEVFVSGCAYFTNQDGKDIAHSMVEANGLQTLHKELWDELLKDGIEVEHSHPEFTPHVTLSYDHGRDYDGVQPEGSWTCDSIELWHGVGTSAAKISLSGSQK